MERIPRKWEYISEQLEKFGAPGYIIEAAKKIDYILLTRGLGWNTDDWIYEYTVNLCDSDIDIDDLFGVLVDAYYCTACIDAGNNCDVCKLRLADNKCIVLPEKTGSLFEKVYEWIEYYRNYIFRTR